MKDYAGRKVRNVCIAGHTGSGKTGLLESILYNTKLVDRFGKAVDGTSTIDCDAEEVKRGMSVYTSLVPVEYRDYKINFLDAPGYLDFEGEMEAAMAVADSCVIVVDAQEGVQSGTLRAYHKAQKYNLPVIFFVTRIDEVKSKGRQNIEDLQQQFKAAPLILPVINASDTKLRGVIDVLRKKVIIDDVVSDEIPDRLAGDVEQGYGELVETIAMTDDELTEKYLMGEEFTDEEIRIGLRNGTRSGAVKPIICGSSAAYIGVEQLLDTIIDYTYSYTKKETIHGTDDKGRDVEVLTSTEDPFTAFVFKTTVDAFAQISYVKVTSGVLTTDTPVFNANKQVAEKIGGLVTLRGKEQIKVSRLEAGDIGAILKLTNTETNDSLGTKQFNVTYPAIKFPEGMLGKAIWPKTKNDEDKLSTGLAKIMLEDKSCKLVNNTETREQVLYGVGDQHIDVILNKLKTKYKVEVTTTEPKVQYRETIGKVVQVQGKHKKQSGGAGQYGDVWIKFEPNPDCEELVFEEAVVGGAVPKQYFPAVEAGLRECVTKGVLAGYKVVQLKATLYDGSFHPVDSKEVAFKAAARLAYKKGMPLAKPILLEPIVRAEVTIPSDYVGTIYGDLTKRRGMIMENNALDDGTTVIVAEVPQASMMSYATELRSMTQGNGSFTQEFIRYDRAPQDVTDKVVAAANIKDDDED